VFATVVFRYVKNKNLQYYIIALKRQINTLTLFLSLKTIVNSINTMYQSFHKVLFMLALLLSANAYSQNWDIDLLKEINLERNKSLDPSFKFITNSVSPMSIGAPIAVLGLGLIQKDSSLKCKGIIMVEALCVNAFTTTALKLAFKRDRPFVTYPYLDKQVDAGSYSFPSGHTSSAFALATSLSLAFPKWYVIAPAYLYASAAGYSRMHLGVHYPSDVLAGAIVGTGSALLSNYVQQKFMKSRKKKALRL
jgi:membrane-associated phospholipid phosphatase